MPVNRPCPTMNQKRKPEIIDYGRKQIPQISVLLSCLRNQGVRSDNDERCSSNMTRGAISSRFPSFGYGSQRTVGSSSCRFRTPRRIDNATDIDRDTRRNRREARISSSGESKILVNRDFFLEFSGTPVDHHQESRMENPSRRNRRALTNLLRGNPSIISDSWRERLNSVIMRERKTLFDSNRIDRVECDLASLCRTIAFEMLVEFDRRLI